MRIRERIVLWGYITAVNLLMPLGILFGLPIFLCQEKRRNTLFKRLGFQRLPGTSGSSRPVWVHALSLGETLSSTSLLEELRPQLGERPLYFSVSTLSAMQIASERIRPFVDGLFYFPLDLWWPAHRTLRAISPCLMVFVETDIWPGFQCQLRRTATPALLVNGRLSPGSYRACCRFKSLFAPALNTFDRIYPQSKTEAQRYVDVGVNPQRLGRPGNLKFDVAGRQPGPEDIRALGQRLNVNPSDNVLLAGSTHMGEEEIVMKAYAIVRREVGNVRLILVPRHPARAGEVIELARRAGWNARPLTTVQNGESWDVLVVDVMGVLSRLYCIAKASFVGGSLVRKGGQNPLESAAAGCPVMFGPDMNDFPDIAKWLLESKAAYEVSDESSLGAKWLRILRDEHEWKGMREACRRVVEEHRGSTALIAGEVKALIKVLEEEG